MSTPKSIIVIILFAGGLFRSMQFTALTSLGFADIHQPQMSGASALASMVQQMTFGMGVAFGAIALRLAGLFISANAELLNADEFRIAFGLAGLVALLGITDCLGLDSNAGAEVSGHRLAKNRLAKAPSLPRLQSSVEPPHCVKSGRP
ncbi:MAG: hypothetical protein JO251_08810 [Verrucomicrobia bacterium]|nr:hypothetical protein [Verrucomicrobiota bacterium]